MIKPNTVTEEELAIDLLISQVEGMIADSELQLTPPEMSPHTSLLDIVGHPYADMMLLSRYKVYYGGRDSAKSWTMAEALIKRTLLRKERVLCCREYQNSIADSVHKLLKDTIERLGLDSH